MSGNIFWEGYMHDVSVIIPAFNAERFIKRTIESALRQIGVKFDIIIVNDGSTDTTLDIVTGYAEQEARIKVISYEKNRGPSFARNRGIECASGKYVAFLDADDLWHPHNLALRVEAMNRTNAGAAYSYVAEIDEDDVEQLDFWQLDPEGMVARQLAAYYFLYNGSNLLVSQSVLDAIKENGEWFVEDWLDGAQDWQFAMRVALKSEFAVARQPLCYYRNHGSSRSADPDLMDRGIRRLRNWYESTGNPELADINCSMNALTEAHGLLLQEELVSAGAWFVLAKTLYPLNTLLPDFKSFSEYLAAELAPYNQRVITSCNI